ncbi:MULTISPECIES: hypothetical protein [unclassified Luteococcus]|uniref:hypothetical protein n=1 Tax=unclassified Luteococcus TaxID=2639923 RepID=UPI00313E3B06
MSARLTVRTVRWVAYAADGHGGNVAMQELAKLDKQHPQRYQFSLLRVFGPATSALEILAAESHFKRALRSVEFRMNEN